MKLKHSEVAAHRNRVVRPSVCELLPISFYTYVWLFFFLQDEDSGDSDNEAEEQRKVCLLFPFHFCPLQFVHWSVLVVDIHIIFLLFCRRSDVTKGHPSRRRQRSGPPPPTLWLSMSLSLLMVLYWCSRRYGMYGIVQDCFYYWFFRRGKWEMFSYLSINLSIIILLYTMEGGEIPVLLVYCTWVPIIYKFQTAQCS